MNEVFRRFASTASHWVGSPPVFMMAVGVVVLWAALGPVFRFSDTWQLAINTGTTIVTFLMVFLIQNTQNRDAKAIHLKLDEVIRGLQGARNRLVDLEHMTDAQLDELQDEFQRIRQRAEARPVTQDAA
jgi:low affinity Fe/Cu permease